MRTCSSMVAAVVLAAAVLAGQGPAPQNASAQAQTTAAQSQITAYLNGIGFGMLDRREQALAQITTRAAADARKAAVRARVLDLVGGLPAMSGAVAVKKYGSVEEDGFRVENIAYESTPGYWVTANVFVPQGQGPFPAIVIA